jgi:uncharacterized protein YkwD
MIIKNKIITLLTTFSLLMPLTLSAISFSDLPDTNRYAPAINYLADVGIVQGYSDGTFKPYQNVNRAEFLKLALFSSQIETDSAQNSGFSDVDENAWYAKYVRKAKQAGWIQGYPDGTFKPEQNINKVEAIKIIGEVQKWKLPDQKTTPPFNDTDINAWYTPYLVYAKERNLIEETKSNFIPAALLSRGAISEIIFRSFITRKSGEEIYSYSLINKYPATLYKHEFQTDTALQTPITEPTQEQIIQFTPVEYKTFDANFFNNITLESTFPNTFYKNELYHFTGSITSGTYDTAFVFLTTAENPSNYINFVTSVTNNKFQIPVYFKKEGNYKMGLIAGHSGQSKIVEISVLPSLPTSNIEAPQAPQTAPSMTFANDTTTVTYQNALQELTNISFSQNGIKKDFFIRQNKSSFTINYADFADFSEGATTIAIRKAKMQSITPLSISSAWSTEAKKMFVAIKHHYAEIDNESLTHTAIPETLARSTTITFSGIAKTNLDADAALINANGQVEMFPLTSSKPFAQVSGNTIIPKGNDYQFSYTPISSGTYILEVNKSDGSAAINKPVYVNTGIPLIPDYFDINSYVKPVGTVNLITNRTQLINLINNSRTAHGLKQITLESNLNQLAQLHSEDMRDRNFFGHINPDNETPNDRRNKLGIPMPVGENLAVGPTIEFIHEGLMRSAVHRRNILDNNWNQLGIGIALHPTGSLIVSQEFSRTPYTEIDYLAARNNMINSINEKRLSLNLSSLQNETNIQTVADIWSEKMATQNFFSFTSPDGETLSSLVNKYVSNKTVQALILESFSLNEVIAEILGKEDIKETLTNIGVGIFADSSGKLKITILYTN